MIKILRFLVTGRWHNHQWEVLKVVSVEGNLRTGGRWEQYHLQCKHCGVIEFKESN